MERSEHRECALASGECRTSNRTKLRVLIALAMLLGASSLGSTCDTSTVVPSCNLDGGGPNGTCQQGEVRACPNRCVPVVADGAVCSLDPCTAALPTVCGDLSSCVPDRGQNATTGHCRARIQNLNGANAGALLAELFCDPNGPNTAANTCAGAEQYCRPTACPPAPSSIPQATIQFLSPGTCSRGVGEEQPCDGDWIEAVRYPHTREICSACAPGLTCVGRTSVGNGVCRRLCDEDLDCPCSGNGSNFACLPHGTSSPRYCGACEPDQASCTFARSSCCDPLAICASSNPNQVSAYCCRPFYTACDSAQQCCGAANNTASCVAPQGGGPRKCGACSGLGMAPPRPDLARNDTTADGPDGAGCCVGLVARDVPGLGLVCSRPCATHCTPTTCPSAPPDSGTVAACDVNGVTTQCTPTITPEVCDGLDNNCNGSVDENIPSVPCTTGMPGICSGGNTACVAGRTVCQPTNHPATETCDGLDNNCNGIVDDGITPTTAADCTPSGCQSGFTVPCHNVCIDGRMVPRPIQASGGLGDWCVGSLPGIGCGGGINAGCSSNYDCPQNQWCHILIPGGTTYSSCADHQCCSEGCSSVNLLLCYRPADKSTLQQLYCGTTIQPDGGM